MKKIVTVQYSEQFEDYSRNVWWEQQQDKLILSPRNWGKWLKRFSKYHRVTFTIVSILDYVPLPNKTKEQGEF